MVPPGMPKMTSTPTASIDAIRDWAPVMICLLSESTVSVISRSSGSRSLCGLHEKTPAASRQARVRVAGHDGHRHAVKVRGRYARAHFRPCDGNVSKPGSECWTHERPGGGARPLRDLQRTQRRGGVVILCGLDLDRHSLH